MTLDQAIATICAVHTQDDEQLGFTICWEAEARFDELQTYWQAWNTLRQHIGELPSNPPISPPRPAFRKLQVVATNGTLRK